MTHELVLLNDLDELEKLSDWLSDRSAQFDLSTQRLFRLQLVLEEVVTNIIQNGYSDTDEHRIIVQLSYRDSEVCISVIDDGVAFNPIEYPEVSLPTSLEEAEVGGLGIHLIRQYTDSCQYQRNNNANVLTMTFCDREVKV